MGFRKYHDAVCFTLACFFPFSFSLSTVSYRRDGKNARANEASAEAASGSVGGTWSEGLLAGKPGRWGDAKQEQQARDSPRVPYCHYHTLQRLHGADVSMNRRVFLPDGCRRAYLLTATAWALGRPGAREQAAAEKKKPCLQPPAGLPRRWCMLVVMNGDK